MKVNPLLKDRRLYVKWERSHNSRDTGADSICGSVYRKFEKNDSRYYDVIASISSSQRLSRKSIKITPIGHLCAAHIPMGN